MEQKHLISAGGVYKLDLAAHHAEIRMKAVSVKYPILGKRIRLQQAPACDVFRDRNAGHFQDGGVNICDFCRPVNGKVMGDSSSGGRYNKQRNMGGAFKEQVFLGHVVISQHFPMIRGENDPGVPEQIVFPERAEQAAQFIINLGDAGIIGPAGCGNLFGSEQMHIGVFIGAREEALRRFLQIPGPVTVDRGGHGDILVERPEIPAGIKRRMGLGKAGPEEEGAGGVSCFQKINGLIGDPGSDAVFYIDGGKNRFHFTFTDSVGLRACGFRFPVILAHVVQRKGHLFKAITGPGRFEMHLPFGAGLIAGVGEKGGQGAAQFCLTAHFGFMGSIGYHAAFISVAAGHNGGPGRDADGAAGIAAAEAGSHCGHVIKVGCENTGVSPGVDGVETLLVGGN